MPIRQCALLRLSVEVRPALKLGHLLIRWVEIATVFMADLVWRLPSAPQASTPRDDKDGLLTEAATREIDCYGSALGRSIRIFFGSHIHLYVG